MFVVVCLHVLSTGVKEVNRCFVVVVVDVVVSIDANDVERTSVVDSVK